MTDVDSRTDMEMIALIERSVLSSISEGVIVNGVDDRVVLLNQSAAEIVRIDAKAAKGQLIHRLFEAFSTRGRNTIVEAIDRLYADPYSYAHGQGITETIIDVGMKVIQTRMSPLLTEFGEFLGIVTLLRDITREVDSERAKTEFVSNVSHELRTPLTSIKGYVDLLLSDIVGAMTELQKDHLRIVQNNANHLVRLINDLLDVSHIDSGRFELDIFPTDMEAIIREAVDMIRPQTGEKQIDLNLDIGPDVGLVLGDRKRLMQVIINLISNSCRYTPDGGQILVSLKQTEGAVRVDVTDTGIGINVKDQAKIFQRFYRVDNTEVNEVQGTGLGLPIVKMLVELHGGRIWVDSEAGEGSTFTVILPTQSADADMGYQDNPVEREKHTVLVVEDAFELAELIERQLQHEGYKVVTSMSGREALKLARSEHIDLITLDMMLPDMGGMEVLSKLKSDVATADIPVIIMSVVRTPIGGPMTNVSADISESFALEKLMDSVHQTLATL